MHAPLTSHRLSIHLFIHSPVTYDGTTHQATLVARAFKVIIADECHYLKNPRAARTKALLPLLKSARSAILISGTPALSRPIELYTQLHALMPRMWQNEKDFSKRYCKPTKEKTANGTAAERKRYGAEKKGASHTQELHIVLSNSIMIRRLKKDILQQMPKKVRRIVKVEVCVRLSACCLSSRGGFVEQTHPYHSNTITTTSGKVDDPTVAADLQERLDEIKEMQSNAKNKRRRLCASRAHDTDDDDDDDDGGGGGAGGAGADDPHTTRKAALLGLFTLSGAAKVDSVLKHVGEFLDDPLSGKVRRDGVDPPGISSTR